MKSFGISLLYLVLALLHSSSAMRPHSFLIPNTEMMGDQPQETVSKNEVSWSRRRGGKVAASNDSTKEVETVVRILRGNNWGMTPAITSFTAAEGSSAKSDSHRNGGR